MQASPGQAIFTGPQILVERLVHVPEETDAGHWREKKLRTGAGDGVFLIISHSMALNASSSTSSASSKSIFSAARAAGVAAGFRSVSDMRGFSAMYVAGFGRAANEFTNGPDDASKCVMGRSPRIRLMVCSTEVVLYMLLSTMPRR